MAMNSATGKRSGTLPQQVAHAINSERMCAALPGRAGDAGAFK